MTAPGDRPPSAAGRQGEVANGRFGAVQFEEPGLGRVTAIRKPRWPFWLRVVRCRPLGAGGSGCDGANGPALEKPPGRKPRGEPRWLSEAIPLWGFKRLQPGLKRYSGSPKARFGTRHAGFRADRPFYPVRRPVKTEALAPKGKARPHRCSPMNCHREDWVVVVHETPCGNGGARICCPRPKVSMTTMAAPQSGHTKVG